MRNADLYRMLSEHLTPHKQEIFARIASNRTRYITVVAEDIYQAHNSSAILRSAECWGVQDVHFIENENSFHLRRRVAKGADDWLTLYRYNDQGNNTESCLAGLRQRGYAIAITELGSEALSPSDVPLDKPLAVLMGTELTGVSETAKKYADYRLVIPMYGFTESLNVSVASAVLMQELISRVRHEGIQWQLTEDEKLEIMIRWARKSIRWSDYLIQMFESGELGKE